MNLKSISLLLLFAVFMLVLVGCGGGGQPVDTSNPLPTATFMPMPPTATPTTTATQVPPTATPTATGTPDPTANTPDTPYQGAEPASVPTVDHTDPEQLRDMISQDPQLCDTASGLMAELCMDRAAKMIKDNPALCDTATGMMAYMCQNKAQESEPTTHESVGSGGSGETANPCDSVPEVHRKECEDSFKNNPNAKPSETTHNDSGGDINPGNLMAENFDPNNLPKVAKSNFTELDKFSRMTKLRSGVGHDFSFSPDEYDPTHANCKSMKHYLMPMGVPLEMEAYATTPHTFRWMSIKFFSPVDGTLTGVHYSETAYGTEARFTIASSEYPGYNFMFFHLALDPDLEKGSVVQAGQQIATLGAEDTWGEIAVAVNVGPGDQRLLSFLQIASDEVLQEYKARGINDASDVIVPREQRDANPLACDDSEAGWFIGSGREGTKEDMPFIIWQFESTDNWFFFD